MSRPADPLRGSVLMYRLSRPAGLKESRRSYLLWPALAYKVVAPLARRQHLNVLQKAVLGLHRAGVTVAAQVADYLNVAPQLTSHIALELRDEGFLNDSGELTRWGREILEREAVSAEADRVGYVFKDPWRNKLWPRFVERLAFANVQREDTPAGGGPDRGYLYLVRGTVGTPRKERLTWVDFPPEASEAAPTTSEILHACRAHRRRHRQLEQAAGDVDDNQQSDVPAEGAVAALRRVSLVESVPRWVWLTTYLFTPQDARQGDVWQVCDPFGFGLNRPLREWIEERKTSVQPLAKMLSRLLGEQEAEQVAAYRAYLEGVKDRAWELVRQHFDDRNLDPELVQRLVDVETALLEIQELQEACDQSRLESILNLAQKPLEWLLQLINRRHPTRGCYFVLSDDPRQKKYNRDLLNGIARQLGVVSKLPTSLTELRRGKIQSAADSGEGTLNPMLAAALLTAHQDPNHPLRAALAQDGALLHKLAELSKIRDQASHVMSRKRRQPISHELVHRQVEFSFQAVSLLDCAARVNAPSL